MMVQVALNGSEVFSSWGTCIIAGFNILPTALFLLNLDLVLESICHYQSKLAVMLKAIHHGLSQGCNFRNWIVNNSFHFFFWEGGERHGIFTFFVVFYFQGPEKLSDIDKSLHLLYIYIYICICIYIYICICIYILSTYGKHGPRVAVVIQ